MSFVVMLIFTANCVRYLREVGPDHGGALFAVVVEGILLALAFIAISMLVFKGSVL